MAPAVMRARLSLKPRRRRHPSPRPSVPVAAMNCAHHRGGANKRREEEKGGDGQRGWDFHAWLARPTFYRARQLLSYRLFANTGDE